MADFIIQMTFRCLHQFCHRNAVASSIIPLTYRKQLSRQFLPVCGRKFSSSWDKEEERFDNSGEHSENTGKLVQLVVTSLRVDRVAASGLGLARRKIDHSLLVGHLFLNGKKVTKKSDKVTCGDIIERLFEDQPNREEIKFGQVKVVHIGDLTKKGNYHIEILRNKSLSLLVQDFWSKHK